MKLSKREQTLVGGLCCCAMLFAYYNFIFSPQMKIQNELNEKVKKNNEIISQIKDDIKNKDTILKQIKILNTKIDNEGKNLFPDLKQDRIIVILDGMIKNSGIVSESISFDEIKVSNIIIPKDDTKDETFKLKELESTYKGIESTVKPLAENKDNVFTDNTNTVKEKQGTGETASQVDASKGVYLMKSTISWSGSYEQIYKFIQEIEKSDKKIIVEGIAFGTERRDIMQDGKGRIASVHGEKNIGEIRLAFYGVPKIVEQDKAYFDWEFNNGYGKNNPFLEFSDYTKPQAQIEKKENRGLGDFAMTVKPTSSDLPTVMMGRYGDSDNRTYVYGDSDGVLASSFQLTQKGQKYYVSYAIAGEQYPATEYTPKSSDVTLDIMSSIRNGANDKSGVSVSIDNKTDLTLNVNIIGDDKSKPRVKIARKSGNVKVND